VELRVPTNNSPSGFAAGVYQRGDEIVIAYTGTNESAWRDFGRANLLIGVAQPSDQVTEAMLLYEEILKDHKNARITFTGHSLGGGLASLMAVFFGREATTFDAALFEATAIFQPTLLIASMCSRSVAYQTQCFRHTWPI
jgi:dienelactone hydrolase